jgi:transcriptional regulator of acetoin/glycerol metabolism
MQRVAEAAGESPAIQDTVEQKDGSRVSRMGDSEIISIAELEKQAILGTIQQLNGDKLLAAKLLGIGKTTLYRKLKEYGIAEIPEE